MTIVLQVYCRVSRRKKFENRSIFAKDEQKYGVLLFTHGLLFVNNNFLND